MIEYGRTSTACLAGWAMLMLLAAGGCGSDQLPVYPTEAIVLLDDEPFGPTKILLVPTSEGARTVAGTVDAQGMVTFTSYKVGDGAPAGEYRVVVGTEMAPPPKPFPIVYRSMERSPLKVTVEPKDKNELVIAMDSKAGTLTRDSSYDMLRRPYESEEFKAGATD